LPASNTLTGAVIADLRIRERRPVKLKDGKTIRPIISLFSPYPFTKMLFFIDFIQKS
jgi:hypothetical protein